MKKILLIFLALTGLAIASCTTEPGAISTTFLTNYVELVITNSTNNVVDANLMNAVRGEWMVTFETFMDDTNGFDASSNFIDLPPFLATNTYDSLTNGGSGGAYSYVFKSDFMVDKNVYDTNGVLFTAYTNLYQYSILSNAYGYRIDLTITGDNMETHYIQPVGPFTVLSESIENIITKTNMTKFGTIMSIYQDTNDLFLLVNQTNGWQHVIEIANTIDSFVFVYSIASDVTNMSWLPDTNLNTVINDRANNLSQRTESQNIVINVNEYNSSESSHVDLQLNEADSYILKKIK